MAFVAPDPFSAKASVSEAEVFADSCVSAAIVSAALVAIDGVSVPVAARVFGPSATGPSGPCARKRPAWSCAASSSSTPALSRWVAATCVIKIRVPLGAAWPLKGFTE